VVKKIVPFFYLFIILLSGCEDFLSDSSLYSGNVTVRSPDRGSFSVSADSSNQGGKGEYRYRKGTRVALRALPAEGAAFGSWTGSYANYQANFSFTIDRDISLNCNFSTLDENSWLVLVYMAGANSLENDGLLDMNKMEYGLALADQENLGALKVITLFDRISAEDMAKTNPTGGFNSSFPDTTRDGNWTGTRLYEVVPDTNTETLKSQIIAEALPWRHDANQEEHMGNQETLASFISWALSAYPGYRHQALILWNHGGGVSISRSITASETPRELPPPLRSICLDDEDYQDGYGLNGQLFLGEIREVLKRFYGPSKKLDVIGFDACYMGMYEVAYQFRDLASYFAASPGLEYSGWDYRNLFKNLHNYSSGGDFVREQVLSYADASQGLNHSMTAYDLSKIQGVKSAFDGLASVIAGELEKTKNGGGNFTRTLLESLRDNRDHRQPGTFFFPETQADSLQYPFFEMGSFCDALISYGNNEPIAAAAEALKSALQAGVVYAWKRSGYDALGSGKHIPRGLSFFFSRGDQSFYSAGKDASLSHYANHWFYTSLDTNTTYAPGFYYGHIDAADSNSNGIVETWRELLEYLYDPEDTLSPGTY
jgi:hypothetical protein